jgi:DNA-binding NarL/FixJ family response regulator
MIEKKSTRVAIASDQAIYLRGLASLVLSVPDFALVGEAVNRAEVVQLCQLMQPDILLIDLKSDHQHGHEVVHNIQKQWAHIKIVLMCETQEVDLGPEDPNYPPVFYFSRDVSEDEFKEALIQVGKAAPQPVSGQEHTFFHHQDEDGDEHESRPKQPPVQRSEELLTRELVMAGRIQEDILPEEPPIIPGWDIAARLEPARETSGDFYDFIPLANNKWGVLVADVSDKGMGAALFMALTSTLFRTYAARFPTLPGLTMNVVNERILSDTRGNMFVTSFFGVLEPHTGRLNFSNAGHPPAYLISTQRSRDPIHELRTTGMALGISEQARWKQKMVRMNPGDILVLYTDGITEAQDQAGDYFQELLLDVILSKAESSAAAIVEHLLSEVHRFVGKMPRQDDIALLVIRRTE